MSAIFPVRTEQLPEILQGGIGVALGAFLVVVAIFWLLFPMIIWVQMKSVIELLKDQHATLRAIEHNQNRNQATAPSPVRSIPGING